MTTIEEMINRDNANKIVDKLNELCVEPSNSPEQKAINSSFKGFIGWIEAGQARGTRVAALNSLLQAIGIEVKLIGVPSLEGSAAFFSKVNKPSNPN